MTRATCPRLFEVEAARDGRLAGAELASFARHMSACPVCSREAQALDAPAAALRAGSAGKRDELYVRRERTRLLASFDQGLLVPQPAWGRRLLWLAPLAALAAGLLMLRRTPAPQPARSSSAVVRASSAALWSETTRDQLEQVRLERGSLWLHVDHASRPSRRLLVLLPDGELEDTGTTFSVSTEDGRTTRVEVQDGSVVLRVRGRLPVALGAGETWNPGPTPAASAAASPTPSAETPPTLRAAPPSPTAPAASSAEPLAPSVLPNPSDDFRAAMARLDSGDSLGAAAAFATFLAKHPRDPRAEDAAYLRVIALHRSGDDSSMKQAAQTYLSRYPTGFRRAEVAALSR